MTLYEPQAHLLGTILSPLLFYIYPKEFQVEDFNLSLFQYADDMTLVALLHQDDTFGESTYFRLCISPSELVSSQLVGNQSRQDKAACRSIW
uniref:Reverse transcriptase domain-containing protein n=1 Tax=Anguilla anguilla TaxID=7936 RepID=A0A0E9RQS8_ANGAN